MPLPRCKSEGMKFEEWFAECKRLAKTYDAEWMISTDPEDHREGFEDNDTPQDEVALQLSYCD